MPHFLINSHRFNILNQFDCISTHLHLTLPIHFGSPDTCCDRQGALDKKSHLYLKVLSEGKKHASVLSHSSIPKRQVKEDKRQWKQRL